VPAPAADDTPFWKRKTLEEMTAREWESLCDGCGRCCLNKLEEEGTEKIFFTDVACKLLDHETCRCKDYRNRLKKVPDCVGLTPAEVRTLDWLPPTCAYDLLAKGKDLYWWHPLVSGDPETVHIAGISVRGRVGACETKVPDDQLENWIVSWPGRMPKAAAKPDASSAKKRAGRAAATPAASKAKGVGQAAAVVKAATSKAAARAAGVRTPKVKRKA
jgi:hypothetical protein